MLFNKITVGFVVQKFNQNGQCIYQYFVAGDECEYETDEGDAIDIEQMPLKGNEYFSFDMVQPNA